VNFVTPEHIVISGILNGWNSKYGPDTGSLNRRPPNNPFGFMKSGLSNVLDSCGF